MVLLVLGVVLGALVAYAAVGYWMSRQSSYEDGSWCATHGCGVLVPSPTDDPTAGWKTYANAQYGFSFKYPADQTLHEEVAYSGAAPAGFSVGLETDFGVHEPGYKSPIPDYQRFELDIADISPIASIGERACYSAFEGTSCITEYRTINGELFVTTAFELTDGEAAGDKEKEAAIVQNGRLFHFYTGFRGVPQEYSVAELARTETVFDRILSTFRFTK
jgi:hypothetical protein